jgi:hypothetical protein
VDGHGVRARALAGRGGRHARAAAGRVAAGAGRRAGGEPQRDPRRGRGAPGPQAVERAAGRGRAAGHRLRHLPGDRIHHADASGPGRRVARVHVARAGDGLRGRGAERHLQPGCGARVRGDRRGTVRYRDYGRPPVPRRARGAHPGPGAAQGAAADRALPRQGPPAAPHRQRPAGRGRRPAARRNLAARVVHPHVPPGHAVPAGFRLVGSSGRRRGRCRGRGGAGRPGGHADRGRRFRALRAVRPADSGPG